MKNRFDEFLALHHSNDLLHIGNVWNAQSAKVFGAQGFKAVATSSAAVASSLGFSDGEGMAFDDYLFVVQRIIASTDAIVSVDIEGGYGRTAEEISSHIKRLYEVGVSGINIEDSVVNGVERRIIDAGEFAAKMRQIMGLLDKENIKMFINLRSDSFLLDMPGALKGALARIQVYQETGVHGLFFPCVNKIADITQLTAASKLPVNVMCIPGLPSFDDLQKAGVKRVSDGPFLNMHIYKALEDTIAKIRSEDSFASLF
ncbi:isocitrate lyase/PEP mutase family protein [Chitinophaga ginsengisoli]|uniref:2-methylisocitrate lyase-like PEP mutase family enzyme n=1 Tax=Chitinophaga ginsengisoli TaxID=363837 RepID=A0A2P8FUK9_9BACT|nr:isocitrate lyase/phosphoenolpyruvate mutase family protein [Chitinophaga ginsengisoli]PSL25410.1 2-methylisocitrate lyase-like PEP mutase family enzyme [Chitinophaga ginsengisoli]